MRRAIKNSDSEILTKNLSYPSNREKISSILLDEQKKFCAYTDEYISRTDAKDIEHFNPKLKNTPKDNYNNWFLVKHQWNSEKSSKWDEFQPILHPTAVDFEERIVYIEGDYMVKDQLDIEASNLIRLLNLDDAILAEKRKKYIQRKHKEIKIYGTDSITFFRDLINDDNYQVSYLRAIKEEFNVDLWDYLK